MSTKIRILDAAEQLFCELGFDNTSLRAITSAADVNLASVNYHFGSKKQLIQDVLQRYMDVLMPALDEKITNLMQKPDELNAELLFSDLAAPLLSLEKVRPNGAKVFVQLFAKAYYESQGHLKKFINNHYGDVLQRFNKALYTAVPHLSPSDVFWRWHFALGSCVFIMASSKALTEIAAADYHQHIEIEELISEVVHYIAAGFAAPNINSVRLVS